MTTEVISDWQQSVVQIIDQCHDCSRKMHSGQTIWISRTYPIGHKRICPQCHRQPALSEGVDEPVATGRNVARVRGGDQGA